MTTIEFIDPMAKRRYGSGSIRKRGQHWEIGYRLPNGRQRWEVTNTPDKDIAETILAERILDIKKGKEDLLADTKFSVVAEDWLKNKRIEGITPKTDEMFSTIINCHLIPELGDLYLYEIKVSTITDYRNKKLLGDQSLKVGGKATKAPMSSQSVVHQLRILRQIFDYGMTNELTDRNPAQLVKMPSIKRPPIEPIDPDDVKALIEKTPYEYRTLMLLLVSTGMRISEATGLRQKDWDSKNQELKVRGAVKRKGGKLYLDTYTKTTSGLRTLKISDALAEKLDEQLARAKNGKDPDNNKLLFPNKVGRFLNPSNLRNRIFTKAAKEAGLGNIRLHDLRHTYASEQLSAGVPQHIVQKNGGWANAGSLSIYSHLTTADRSKEADSADLYS